MTTNTSMTIMTTVIFARTTACALACLLATAVTTTAVAQESKKERTQDDFNTIDAGKLPVTFPFREIANHVVVEVAFGEDPPLPFMFDTGAASFVTAEIAQAHGGEVLGKVPGAAGGNKVIENALRTYAAVTVAGSVEIRELMAIEPWAVDNSLLHCVTPYGLLGASALLHAVWQVDYGAGEITVAASVDQLDHIDGALAVPFTPQPGLSPTPIVELPVGSGKLTFIVDSGSGLGIAVNTADAATVGIEITADTPQLFSMAAGAAGAFEAPLAFVEAPVTLGDREIRYPVTIADGMAPTTQGNIGHGFLKNFVVTWDWSGNTMYLDPIAGDGSVPDPKPPGGAAIGWDGEKIVVTGLTPGSAAASAGLTIGQVVSAVDGKNVKSATIDDFCAVFTAGPHQTLTTEDGTTFDIGPVEGFYGGREAAIPEIGPDQLAFSVDNMDTSVDPGEDFYRYASGKWQERMERPADKESIGAISYQAELLKAQLKAAAARAAAGAAEAPRGSPLQQVGTFYQAYMDTQARDAAGMTPLRGELERIDAIASLDDLARHLGEQAAGVGATPLALLIPITDLVDNTVYKIYAGAGELGLKEMNKLWLDTYHDEPGSARKTAYAAYIRDVLKIAGYQAEPASKIAGMIVTLETDLHSGQLTPTEMGNPRNFYNPMTTEAFQALIPELKLQPYFAGLGLELPEQITNSQARYFPNLSKILQTYPLDDLKDYLSFMTIHHFAPVLSTAFEEPTRALNEVMTGLAELPPREERAVSLLRENLGHPMSQVFVDQFFADATRAAVLDMIGRIKAIFIDRIKTRAWLSEATRAEALHKAESLSYLVGYPDQWIDYSPVDIGSDLVTNLINLGKFSSDRYLAFYGGPVQSDPMADPERTLPMVLNAAYNTQINGFEVTAAIVRPPMFMPEMDAAVNFCRLGAALGHEMTHGFDSGGRQFDAGGAMRDWWTAADAAAFTAEAQKLIEQGNAYEILPGLHTNGELNVKENMADVGGITLAFEALKDYLAEHPGENVEIDGLSPAQRCFISWAQLWTEEMSEQKLRGTVANDFHPPNVYRTTAALQHVDAFYEAFGIEAGDPMWLAPEKRVNAW